MSRELEEQRKAATCSTGRQPDWAFEGRRGGQNGPEPATSPRYHCSKSNLDLPASAWCRDEGGSGARVEERREEIRKHPKVAGRRGAFVLCTLKSWNYTDFLHLQHIIAS